MSWATHGLSLFGSPRRHFSHTAAHELRLESFRNLGTRFWKDFGTKTAFVFRDWSILIPGFVMTHVIGENITMLTMTMTFNKSHEHSSEHSSCSWKFRLLCRISQAVKAVSARIHN